MKLADEALLPEEVVKALQHLSNRTHEVRARTEVTDAGVNTTFTFSADIPEVLLGLAPRQFDISSFIVCPEREEFSLYTAMESGHNGDHYGCKMTKLPFTYLRLLGPALVNWVTRLELEAMKRETEEQKLLEARRRALRAIR